MLAAAEGQGLRVDGPEEVQKPIAGPHATLFLQWGYLGSVEVFLSEEPLLPAEQAIVAAALATLPGWQMGCWWQGGWPVRCGVCLSDRDQAFRLMERQGCICPICLPMEQERIGQPRPAGLG